MTHRNYLAGMTPTHFRGLPFDIWNTLIAEVGCSFRFVVLNATVFDCHIFDRPLSTQFLAYLSSSLSLPLSLKSHHFPKTGSKPSNNDICTVFAFLTSLAHAGVPITKQAILQILSMTALKTWRKKEGEGKAVGDEDLIAVVNNAHAHLLIM
ncbi:hypothetical protein BLNAU_25031 [Blattamonas nauphoetae]|uniref:Uncharacterized protein n=1 Tax=Blattamonas nauphoetae TaxID=2049346 RepID=A0ABQ9WKR4_9EUKA|nr:hypothetical protein BLNAU_25031 [Blattamonas nauphoetae]